MQTQSTRSVRTIFPAKAYTPELLSHLQSAHDAGHDIDELLTVDPWVLEQRLFVAKPISQAA